MIEHIVKENETLETIAKKYNTTVEKIIQENNIVERERLGIGNKLIINNETKEKIDKK